MACCRARRGVCAPKHLDSSCCHRQVVPPPSAAVLLISPRFAAAGHLAPAMLAASRPTPAAAPLPAAVDPDPPPLSPLASQSLLRI